MTITVKIEIFCLFTDSQPGSGVIWPQCNAIGRNFFFSFFISEFHHYKHEIGQLLSSKLKYCNVSLVMKSIINQIFSDKVEKMVAQKIVPQHFAYFLSVFQGIERIHMMHEVFQGICYLIYPCRSFWGPLFVPLHLCLSMTIVDYSLGETTASPLQWSGDADFCRMKFFSTCRPVK